MATAITDALIGARFLDKGGAVYNVRHPDFGGIGDGVADDGLAFNKTRAGVPSDGGVVLVPPGSYLLTTAFTFAAQTGVQLLLLPGVVLTGSALPIPTGTNSILDWRSGIGKFTGTFEVDQKIIVETAAGQAGLFKITRGGVLRWQAGWANSPDSWVVFRYNDAGSILGTALDIDRSTGKAKFEADVEVGSILNTKGAIDLDNDIELAEKTTAVVASPQNDFATGTVTVQRVSTTVVLTITGLAGGRAGRIIYFQKFAPLADITFTHEDANSTAANRIRTHDGSSFTLTGAGAMWIRYDSSLSRWMLGPHSN